MEVNIESRNITESSDKYMDISQYEKVTNLAVYSKRFLLLGQRTINKFYQRDCSDLGNIGYLEENYRQYIACSMSSKTANTKNQDRENLSFESNKENPTQCYDFQVFTFPPSKYPSNNACPFLCFDNFDMSSIDTVSPSPTIQYCPQVLQCITDSNQINGLIGEILKSEEEYLNSLNLLLNFYIDSCSHRRDDIWKPLEVLQHHLKNILKIHKDIFSRLKKLCTNLFEIFELVEEILKIITEKALNVYLYLNYCAIYDDIILCLNSSLLNNDGNIRTSKNWYQGWGVFLESTQPILKSRDLSFISLLQGPISRLGKYNILITKLCEHFSLKNSEILSKYLEAAKAKLWKINNLAGDLNTTKHNTINRLVNFKKVKYETNISLQFFGKPLLVGSLFGVWVDTTCFQFKTLGCFLYKTHLILCSFNNNKSPTEILFIIPLFNSVVKKEKEMAICGLYSNKKESLKIVFEHDYGHYEILMFALNYKEFKIWLDMLELLINVVNGPSTLNFTSVGESYLICIPADMKPCGVKRGCEFQNYEEKNIEVVIDQTSPQNESYRVKYQELAYCSIMSLSIRMIEFDRILVETKLKEVWSETLPLVSGTKILPSVKKSKSWSLVRIPSLKNLQKSNGYQSLSSSGKYSTKDINPINSECETIGRTTSLSFRFKSAVKDIFQKN